MLSLKKTSNLVCLRIDISSINNIWCEALILDAAIFSNATIAIILSNSWIKQVFVISQNNWWDVAYTAITYFYTVFMLKILWCLFVFWKGFFIKLRNYYQYSFWYLQNKVDYTILCCAFIVFVIFIIVTLCWYTPRHVTQLASWL